MVLKLYTYSPVHKYIHFVKINAASAHHFRFYKSSMPIRRVKNPSHALVFIIQQTSCKECKHITFTSCDFCMLTLNVFVYTCYIIHIKTITLHGKPSVWFNIVIYLLSVIYFHRDELHVVCTGYQTFGERF